MGDLYSEPVLVLLGVRPDQRGDSICPADAGASRHRVYPFSHPLMDVRSYILRQHHARLATVSFKLGQALANRSKPPAGAIQIGAWLPPRLAQFLRQATTIRKYPDTAALASLASG